MLPYTDETSTTKEFLQKVIDVLIDFVKATNDRKEKILDFHHPHEMLKLIDLEIPEKGYNLQQLVNDCATTLKYQVKTGKSCGLFHQLIKVNFLQLIESPYLPSVGDRDYSI